MAEIDWRSPQTYTYLSALNAGSLAFEFLRRNDEYRADFTRTHDEEALSDASTAGRAGLARRWGLAFPR